MTDQALLNHILQLGNLCEEDREAILQLPCELRTFKRNQDIAKSGEPPAFSVVVETGFLQRYVSCRDGSRQIHAFYIAGDAPSLESVHLEYLDSSLGAAALSEVFLVPVAELADVMRARPRIQDLIWKSASSRRRNIASG